MFFSLNFKKIQKGAVTFLFPWLQIKMVPAFIDGLLTDRSRLLSLMMKHNFISKEREGMLHTCFAAIIRDARPNRKPTKAELQKAKNFWWKHESVLRKELRELEVSKLVILYFLLYPDQFENLFK